ncbi:MAG: Mfa1 family fimbria major subunit [Bacteroidales bacterium]|nr:Mfa1 family fimbria major subunit [Bacteroidales bacterium]
MKKTLLSAAALLMALTACNKEPVGGSAVDNGSVYMQFSVNMLSTRSQTDDKGDSNSNANPDTEVGLNKENTISTVDIALVGPVSTVVAANVTPTAANASTYVAKFDTQALEAGKTYKVYIYANCSAPETFNVNAVSEATVAEMTADNKFWMTNAYAAEDVKLPIDLSAYTQPNTPFNLGSHTVERSMARFDYKAKNANVYDMGAGLSLTLTEAALINQSKAHYVFRRVADNNKATPVVGGVETPSNWVVDTDWAGKNKDGFDAQLEAPANWSWTSLSGLTVDDNYDDNYKIWCYAKENTLPTIDAQKHNVSTGVVFKAEITAGESASAEVKAALASGDSRIYVFNNKLYGTWADVKKAAVTGTDANLQAAYNQAAAGLEGDAEPAAAAAAAAGFTGYSAEGGKYYTYYYYWNRHNDNLDPYKMGIMEFAVVRNNVYKLCVDSISKFGHPTPPTDPTHPTDPDPDPVKPGDPDESVNYYFTVTVKVLPWTVRINNIEF